VAHRHSHAVHVLDFCNDLFRGATKSDVASLVGESAVAAALEILRGEFPGDFYGFGDRPTWNGAVVRNPHLIAVWIAEPQPPDVLHPVISETERDPVLLAVDRNRANRVLGDA
jgi:hypothetical protein